MEKEKIDDLRGAVAPQKDLLSLLINPKWSTVEGPKTTSKIKKQECEGNGRFFMLAVMVGVATT
ncbi:unnamed protein product [Prunus armeniaca]|uniref:Uncharacterized protein n=1 Tax=Prunus armeniaca TaxID=36596 RepID=A0A6J5X5Z0_PRUAR|nr:unnamed protein product [Prunus armeniaca]